MRAIFEEIEIPNTAVRINPILRKFSNSYRAL